MRNPFIQMCQSFPMRYQLISYFLQVTFPVLDLGFLSAEGNILSKVFL